MGQQSKTTSDMWNHEPVITDNACSNMSDTDTDNSSQDAKASIYNKTGINQCT